MRNIAMFASGNGVHKDFDKAWPVKQQKKESGRMIVTEDMKAIIEKAHGIKL